MQEQCKSVDPLCHYRASDLLKARYTPYKNIKSVRLWMLKHGGRHENGRVLTITGKALMEACS